MQRHRGQVEVASEGVPGKGAVFSVWLPVTGETHG
jgi:signal transduction histidine kinase